MTQIQQYAFVTGGASGIGRATVEMLVKNNTKVFIADRDVERSQALLRELNSNSEVVFSAQVDTAQWTSQMKCFTNAVARFGRIDYVFPIAGEPDLTVVDVDLKGVLYTCALAMQQFRRQDPGIHGFRGKISVVASSCGFYCIPTQPIYTAAKHGVTGFVRSYGQYLPTEKITINAVNPHLVKTNMSSEAFYQRLDPKHFTPMESVVQVLEGFLFDDARSGETVEVGPRVKQTGPVFREAPEMLDEETEQSSQLVYERCLAFHIPQ